MRTRTAAPALLLLAAAAAAQDAPSRRVNQISTEDAKPTAVALNGDGQLCVLGSDKGLMTIFDPSPTRAKTLWPFNGHGGEVKAIAFGPDDSLFASAGADGVVRLWETAHAVKLNGSKASARETRPKAAVATHKGAAFALAFSPDGKRLATGGADGAVRVWSVAKFDKPVFAVPAAHRGGVLAVAYSPDGESVVSGGADKAVKVWKADKAPVGGKPARAVADHPGPVTSVAVSGDGKQLAAGSGVAEKEGVVKLWEFATGKPAGAFAGHTDVVTVVLYHPDGKRLASAGRDGAIRVWDLQRALEAYQDKHRDPVTGLAYSRNGKVMASTSPEIAYWWKGDAPLPESGK